MRGPLKPLGISLIVVAALVALLVWHPSRKTSQGPEGSKSSASLLVYCAANAKRPVDAIAKEYEKLYGVQIQLQYGGSGTLLNNLQIAQKGDLFLAADSSYIDLGHKKNLLDEVLPIAHMVPVIAVAKGNPKKIASVNDLLRPEIKTSFGNPTVCAVGLLGQNLLQKINLWDDFNKAIEAHGVFKPTVTDVANDVKIGTADAGVVWDATVAQYPELQGIALPNAANYQADMSIAVLHYTKQPTEALRFARYMTARDTGLPHFTKDGYHVVEGDVWAVTPKIIYFSGAVNRLAIQDTIKAFAQREGVQIETTFNGCGILVGTIKAGEHPDVYHTCDRTFMNNVQDLFEPAVNVSQTDIVILVPKGNPKKIHKLADLGAVGLRVGLANEKQSTLGALTARMLREDGVYDAVYKNVKTTTPTADMLVNQIVTGSLDVVVVYAANTTKVRDKMDVLPIERPGGSTAIQTFAIGKNSQHKYLLQRLFDAIRSPASEKHYTDSGFRWLAPPGEK